METSFCELKGKEVINISDGKRLGRIIDLVFETNCGKVLGFVVPCYNKSWNIFKSGEDIFIPYSNVCKIGDDVILVQIFLPNKQNSCLSRKRTKCHTVQASQFAESQTNFENQNNTKNYTLAQNSIDNSNTNLQQPNNQQNY